MFWLIETNDQFNWLKNSSYKEVFVEIIPNNPYQHPVDNSIIAIYVKPLKAHKGYMLPFFHSECYSLEKEEVIKWLKSLDKIYVRDKKEFLHYIILKQLIDITFHGPPYIPPQTTAHKVLYRRYPALNTVNQIVPITKHYEVCEQMYDDLETRINNPVNSFYNNKCTLAFNAIERNGLKINKNEFSNKFKQHQESASIEFIEEFIYTNYNLKTLTRRPSNTFGGINYAALPKENGSRKAFIPRNDVLIEFDISAYHPSLAAKLVGFNFYDKDIHKSFADMYQVDYAVSKELTFKQLYGGVFEKYKNLEYFRKIEEYKTNLFEEFIVEGKIKCPISGYEFKKQELDNMNKHKLFNYVLQNLETSLNVLIILDILKVLRKKNTKLVLYTYDAFLFDVDLGEKEEIKQIKNVFKKYGLQVKVNKGINYDFRGDK